MKLILFLFAISLSSFVLGQDDVTTKSEACDTTLTYWAVETLPEYKGGFEKLLRDLNTNLNLEKHLNGRCRIDFMINCKGETSGFKFDSSFDKEFGNKFTKTFSELQNWKAGKYRNENVDCSYTLILRIDNGIIKNDKK
jgi:hypothetical protein